MHKHYMYLILIALRDFFIAKSAEQMAKAYDELVRIDGLTPQDIAWPEVEYVFNRIFIGPESPVVPLYASCYLETEPRLMGQSTLQMRNLMQCMELTVPAELNIPDDHLALELEVWARLEYAVSEQKSSDMLEVIQEARYWLICEHMSKWIPQFVRSVLNVDHQVINHVVSCLDSCLNNAKLSFK